MSPSPSPDYQDEFKQAGIISKKFILKIGTNVGSITAGGAASTTNEIANNTSSRYGCNESGTYNNEKIDNQQIYCDAIGSTLQS